MKLADSLNPATQAENIKKLNAGLEAVDAKTLPGTSTATTGQILKLTGETKTPSWADEYSYTPPAYSETETATGQKWIDGKEIYQIGFSGTTSAEVGPMVLGNITYDKIIYCDFLIAVSTGNWFRSTAIDCYVTSVGAIVLDLKNTGAISRPYTVRVLFTKPDPTPGRAPEDSDQEPEPEEKKATKKKTTK